MEKAREEGEQLTKILAENPSKSCYLQQNNCLHKPIHHSESMAIWRPWFYLGLFHLVDSNLSAASEDFTIAFNLASLTLSTDKPLSKSTIGLLMYMKALSALYKSEILVGWCISSFLFVKSNSCICYCQLIM
ncbi:unnamed protein product [Trichobilharzia regenti]|nr:unnamed protein product [Trichobilharzia regenti]